MLTSISNLYKFLHYNFLLLTIFLNLKSQTRPLVHHIILAMLLDPTLPLHYLSRTMTSFFLILGFLLHIFLAYDEDFEGNIDVEHLVDILEYEEPQIPSIPKYWMDELDPPIEFSMKRRSGWLDVEFDILKRGLKLLKLNKEYASIIPKYRLEMDNNLVRTFKQEKFHYFDLFVGFTKEKHINPSI